jgi:hypothetical protein
MRNESQKIKNFGQSDREKTGFVQPEKEYYEKLFSRRTSEGPLKFQTPEDYSEEMRGIEAALAELGEVL